MKIVRDWFLTRKYSLYLHRDGNSYASKLELPQNYPALLILSRKGQLLFAQSYSRANMITNSANFAATEVRATLLGSKSDRHSLTILEVIKSLNVKALVTIITSSVLSWSHVFIKFASANIDRREFNNFCSRTFNLNLALWLALFLMSLPSNYSFSMN